MMGKIKYLRLVGFSDMIKSNIAETKRDVKRDFRGILAIIVRHSLPRHKKISRAFMLG
jgi:hypothetical protein